MFNLIEYRNVSEEELQRYGLATPEVWDQPCFSQYDNRLYYLGPQPCAAAVLASDFTYRQADAGMEAVVAIEVLPVFQRQGIASEIIRRLAQGDRILVNSPSDTLRRSLQRVAEIVERPDIDSAVIEVRFHPASRAEPPQA